MEPIDVVLLTKNSERVLEECLNSIYRNVPVGRLLAVDGGSIDRTLEILNKFNEKHGNVRVLYDKGTRATARQKGINQVRTEWFMFVDSDVVLCRNWYKKAAKCINKRVGSVWGVEIWSTIKNQTALRLFLWLTRKIFEVRGGTHDTLIRTNLVVDIEIPKNLHVFEDTYIKNWITKKGFKNIVCYDPYCIHHRPRRVWTLKGSLNIIADALRFGSFRLIINLMVAYGFYTAYSVYQLLTNMMRLNGS